MSGWTLLDPSDGWEASPVDPIRVREVGDGLYISGQAYPVPIGRVPVEGEEILRLPQAPEVRIGPERILIDWDNDRRSGAYHVGYSVETDGRVLHRERPEGFRRYPEDA